MDTNRKRSIRVLMFPWLAYGHISPFLQLAKSLTKRNFIVYMASSQINIASIRGNLSENDSVSIKLVDLHIPTTPHLPSHYHTTNGLPSHLMPALKKAMDSSRPRISTLLQTLKPDLVIYDFLHPSVPEEAAAHGVPAVLFLSPGAASSSYFIHHCFGNPSSEYPFPGIYFREPRISTGVEASDFERLRECVNLSSQIVLIKSFREIEGKYIDYLSFITGKKFVPVGTLFQHPETTENHHEHERFIKWLDGKSEGSSTVFASFGSEYFLKESEVEEIALGLEESSANFILVLRSPQGEGTCKNILPKGFVERVGERGMVVEGWAPQARILSHPSVGGFLSHCGWSSVMEGIHCSVPIVAVPMHLDQPLNARLVEEVGIGEEVVRNGEGNFVRGEIGGVIGKVVGKGSSGQSLKLKVRELSEKVRGKGEEEVDVVVEELVMAISNVVLQCNGKWIRDEHDVFKWSSHESCKWDLITVDDETCIFESFKNEVVNILDLACDINRTKFSYLPIVPNCHPPPFYIKDDRTLRAYFYFGAPDKRPVLNVMVEEEEVNVGLDNEVHAFESTQHLSNDIMTFNNIANFEQSFDVCDRSMDENVGGDQSYWEESVVRWR
ncbi:UDP-glucosyltransferase 29-like [Henckelia pumila]|uniref:UDP-glucosyltransferase 29-like n=1 Tax=Henckelia pumila TaxID=405737 RepID=UPI003C6E8BC4